MACTFLQFIFISPSSTESIKIKCYCSTDKEGKEEYLRPFIRIGLYWICGLLWSLAAFSHTVCLPLAERGCFVSVFLRNFYVKIQPDDLINGRLRREWIGEVSGAF